ncbi:DNA translocase FtsK [compost metagenome]
MAKNDAETFEADFYLMASTLRPLIADLVDVLGGECADDRQADMFRPATGPALVANDNGDHLVDPLLTDARRVVLEYRRPSISVIQRHLRIGYNRAASLLESLEQFGLVTAMRPDGTREVVYPL